MSLYQLVKSGLFQFKQLKEVRHTSFGKIIFYLVLLSFILAIPITFQVAKIFNHIQEDGKQIAQKLPNFTIHENQLTTSTEEKGFIYQSDYLIFTFDPEGKRSSKDVSNDLIGNLFSIGMLKDKIVLSLKSDQLTSSLLDTNTFEFSYSENSLNHLTGKELKHFLLQQTIPWYLYVFTYLAAIYPSFFSLILSLLFATIFAFFFTRFKDKSFTFMDILKTMIVSATFPSIFSSVFLFFAPTFDSATFIFIASLFIFFQLFYKKPEKRNQSFK